MSRKLHIGGQVHADGWEVLNANPAPYVDHLCNATDLSRFPDGTFSEIYASHVVEHFDYAGELLSTLKEWNRVLEPAGKVYISVPDMDILTKLFLSKDSLSPDERFFVMRMMFGGHVDKYDYHVVGLNEEFLAHFLYTAGYTNIRRVDSFGLFQDTSSMVFKGVAISLNMIAEKPVSPTTGERPPQSITQNPPANAVNKAVEQALAFQQKGRLVDAERLFREILSAHPKNFAALYSLGVMAANAGEYAEALRLIDTAVGVNPKFAPAFFVRGVALQGLKRYEEALASYEAALTIQPDYVEVLINRGNLFHETKRHSEALESFDRALAINPDSQMALGNRGIVLTEMKRNEEAVASFQRLLRINPDYEYGQGLLCYARLHSCDWTDFESAAALIAEGVRAGKRVCKSLAFMSISESAPDQLKCAQVFAAHKFPASPQAVWTGERYRHDKIRIAYVSPDLREHPVGHLMAGVFERHDKSRFETIAISIGVDDRSRLRSRIENAFDRFIDGRQKTSREIADLMRAHEVDIAVDLAGFTADSRTGIFACRAAPIQVNYLGYPGTMGTDYMDYILADRQVIPESDHACYSEKVVYLPDAYLPTDAGLKISARTPTREEAGLPASGFVFCSFNHDYKITPPLFEVWMRLLGKVEGSVLWLMKLNEPAQCNLRREAEARGIDPQRLIFATRVPLVEDHLARYRLAGLFLDTSPYNAHSTASDALLAGLPVLTCTGRTFPARVAGSLLKAIGLPELITHSLEEYEALALKLATDRNLLADLKARLESNRSTHPLFDTDRFCRHLEAAYMTMFERHQRGESPIGFAVSQRPSHADAA